MLYSNILTFNLLIFNQLYFCHVLKKNILILSLLLIISCTYSQDLVDIVTPQQSPFNSGVDIEGWIQNSVNESTGKLAFSVPMEKI